MVRPPPLWHGRLARSDDAAIPAVSCHVPTVESFRAPVCQDQTSGQHHSPSPQSAFTSFSRPWARPFTSARQRHTRQASQALSRLIGEKLSEDRRSIRAERTPPGFIHLQPALPPLFLLAQRDGAAQSRGRVGGAATPTRRSLDSVAKGFTRQDRASLEHGSCPRGGPGGPGRHLVPLDVIVAWGVSNSCSGHVDPNCVAAAAAMSGVGSWVPGSRAPPPTPPIGASQQRALLTTPVVLNGAVEREASRTRQICTLHGSDADNKEQISRKCRTPIDILWDG
ncbi:unnamed protein product [Lampetra fluviatilis]